MLAVVTNYLQALIQTLPFIETLGLGSNIVRNDENYPAYFNGTELVSIDFDKYKAVAYLMPTGNVPRETIEHPYLACKMRVSETYGYKIVVYSQAKETPACESLSQNIAWSISGLLTGKQKQLESAAGFENVFITTTNTVTDKALVWASQSSLQSKLKDADILIAIDINVSVEGVESCFNINPCASSEFHFDIDTVPFCERVNACIDEVAALDAIQWLYSSANTSYVFNGTVTAFNPDGKDFRGKAFKKLFVTGVMWQNIPNPRFTWTPATATLAFISANVNARPANNAAIYLEVQ